jgi:hypothetical protein
VQQPPELTRFAFEPGCQLRMRISTSNGSGNGGSGNGGSGNGNKSAKR